MLQRYYQGDFTSKCFVTTRIWVFWFPCDGTSHKSYRSPHPLTLLWPSYPQNICVVTLIKCTGKGCADVSACRGEGVCRCACLWRRGSVQIPVSVEERECADVSDCGEERVCRCACLWRSVCRFQCLWRCLPIQYWHCPHCFCVDFLSSRACSCSADLCLTFASSFTHCLLHVIFSIKSPSTFFPSGSGRVSVPPFGSMSVCSFLSWQQLNYFTMVCRPGSWVVLWAHWKWLPSSFTLCTIPSDEVGYLVMLWCMNGLCWFGPYS